MIISPAPAVLEGKPASQRRRSRALVPKPVAMKVSAGTLGEHEAWTPALADPGAAAEARRH
jgi:hypothetical protein